MLITSDFVFLYMPRTGGEFVTKQLKEIYPELLELNENVTCSDIPHSYSELPIVSIFRNPFDRYVSQFRYGCWRSNIELYCGNESIGFEYPDINKIDFTDFVRIANKYLKGHHKSQKNGFHEKLLSKKPLGWHSEQYFRFYFKDSMKAFNELTENSIQTQSFLSDSFNVHFLHTDSLGPDLFNYLLPFGHIKNKIKHIKKTRNILPEGGRLRPVSENWRDNYCIDTLKYISDRERILFDLFPRYKESPT